MPLSFPQRRLWILDRIAPGLATYNIPLPLLLEGGADTAALAAVLDDILRRHEVLRTRFATDAAGEPCQVVEPAAPLALPPGRPARPAGAGGPGRAGTARPGGGDPPLRPRPRADAARRPRRLAGAGARRHALLLTVHHIAADGWSLEILLREAEALYAARLAGQPAVLRSCPSSRRLRRLAAPQSPGGPPRRPARLLAPTAGRRRGVRAAGGPAAPRPPQLAGRPGAAAPRLRARRGVAGARPAPSRDAVHGRPERLRDAALAAHGRADGVIGSPSANRDRREIEPLIGFFVNMLVLRGELAPGDRFPELLARTREGALGAYAHRDLPFERLVEEVHPERDAGRNPLFQVMFQLLPATRREPQAGLGVRRLDLSAARPQFDLGLSLVDHGTEIEGALEYARRHLRPHTSCAWPRTCRACSRRSPPIPGGRSPRCRGSARPRRTRSRPSGTTRRPRRAAAPSSTASSSSAPRPRRRPSPCCTATSG